MDTALVTIFTGINEEDTAAEHPAGQKYKTLPHQQNQGRTKVQKAHWPTQEEVLKKNEY